MSTVLRSLRSLVLKLAAATVFVAEAVGHWFSTGGDDLLLGGSRWLLSHIAQNPEAQRAVVQSYLAVSQAMQPHRATAIGLVSTSVAVVLVSVLLPPLVALLVRPRARVFVSFHRSREDDALALQQAMEQAGITVLRMPYSAGAQHQEVVGTTVRRTPLGRAAPGSGDALARWWPAATRFLPAFLPPRRPCRCRRPGRSWAPSAPNPSPPAASAGMRARRRSGAA